MLSHFSRVRLCATPQTAAFQAPLSLGFSRQEYWSGVPLPSPEQQCNILQMPALCPITAYNQLVIGKRKKKKKTVLSSLITTSFTVSGLEILPDTQAYYIAVIFILTLSLHSSST